MVDRNDIGSWLQGPPRVEDGLTPAQRLGLPEAGPGSLAPFGRRLIALFIDGVIAQLIAMGLLGYHQGDGGLGTFKPLLVVFVINAVMVATGGWTIGQRLLGLGVQRLPQGYAGPLRGLVRSVLLCLAIPPLVIGRDGRGLHDRLAGTVIVRTR